MGRKIKLREARRREADRKAYAVLEAHSQRSAPPRPADCYFAVSYDWRRKFEAYEAFALRAPVDWRCRIKSRSDEKRILDLTRFCFARYPVPAHLERVWFDEIIDDFVDDARALLLRPRLDDARPDLRRWYIIATQGGSLHKQVAHPYMTKAETHHFLTTPPGVTSIASAFWYAFARARTDSIKVALQVAQTRLLNFSVACAFWKDAARFFAHQPTSVAEMNDLIDFLSAARQEDENFSLKGRTLQTLRRRMEEWHHILRKQRTICGGAWPGRAMADIDYEAGSEDNKAIWRFRQIKTGNDLFHEGERMHHCVATYKSLCVAGEVSIWSLTCEYPIGNNHRALTIELRKDGLIVQARGFANRMPRSNEVTMVKCWAREHQLDWSWW